MIETIQLPKNGSRWVWEIDKPEVCELLQVEEVFHNGDEWWVRTRSKWTAVPNVERDENTLLNELSRFWEAVTPVGGRVIDLTVLDNFNV